MVEKVFVGNFTRHIVQSIGKSIALGEYPVGQPLPPESDLCESFGASRTVLREAIKMLTAKGMLDARPRRGTVVLPESEWNLTDPEILGWMLDRTDSLPILAEFADMRLAIEPSAAALAASKAQDEDISLLQEGIARMRAASEGKDDPLEADIAFHIALLKASRNRFFWNMRHTIDTALRFSIKLTNRSKGVERASIEDHEQILFCIQEGDPVAAESAMRALIVEAKILINRELRAIQSNAERS